MSPAGKISKKAHGTTLESTLEAVLWDFHTNFFSRTQPWPREPPEDDHLRRSNVSTFIQTFDFGDFIAEVRNGLNTASKFISGGIDPTVVQLSAKRSRISGREGPRRTRKTQKRKAKGVEEASSSCHIIHVMAHVTCFQPGTRFLRLLEGPADEVGPFTRPE